MTEIGTDWRVVDGVVTAWYDASSLTQGAALAGRVMELSAGVPVDLRAIDPRRLGPELVVRQRHRIVVELAYRRTSRRRA